MIQFVPLALASGAAYGAYWLSQNLGKKPATVAVPVSGTMAKVVQPVTSPGKPAASPVSVATPGGLSPLTVTDAKGVQNALNTLGQQPPLAVDGNVGPLTTAAIKQFQAAHGLSVDGLAGPATKAALQTALAALATGASATASHPAVQAAAAGNVAPAINALNTTKDVQHALNLLGASPALVEDGILGAATTAAVKAFQTGHGLSVDGLAGPATKAAMLVAIGSRAPVPSPFAGTGITGM